MPRRGGNTRAGVARRRLWGSVNFSLDLRDENQSNSSDSSSESNLSSEGSASPVLSSSPQLPGSSPSISISPASSILGSPILFDRSGNSSDSDNSNHSSPLNLSNQADDLHEASSNSDAESVASEASAASSRRSSQSSGSSQHIEEEVINSESDSDYGRSDASNVSTDAAEQNDDFIGANFRNRRSSSSTTRSSRGSPALLDSDDNSALGIFRLGELFGASSNSSDSGRSLHDTRSNASTYAGSQPRIDNLLRTFARRDPQRQLNHNDFQLSPPIGFENYSFEEHQPLTMAGPSTSRPATASTATSTISFECSVCLENLDLPASIVDPAAAVDVQNNPGGSGRGANWRGNFNADATNPTSVVATACGHMYHQICLEKWFQEQGRRTCPSCRKNVPKTKLIRLYPNISNDVTPKAGTSSASRPSSAETQGTTSVAAQPATTGTTGDNNPPHPPNACPNGACDRADCQDLRVIHTTLMNDYADLQTRFDNIRDGDDVKQALIQSLEEDNNRKALEIDRLKREMESAPSTSNGAKRRRH